MKVKTGLVLTLSASLLEVSAASAETTPEDYDVVVVGGTPGGVMAAIAAAREDRSVVLLDRYDVIGGLPANGLGATDIHTRGATGGLFLEFIERIYDHYLQTYGKDSPQVAAASGGYRFEPSVAQRIFERMLAEHSDRITIRSREQFDARPDRVISEDGTIEEIRVVNRDTGEVTRYAGRVFVDATYEGDLAAAAGAPFRLGREGRSEFDEPMAGQIYKYWGGSIGEHTTGLADGGIQAYNYRLCLTNNPDNREPLSKPDRYDRHEYVSLIEDIRADHHTFAPARDNRPMDWDGIGRVTNMVALPNDKVDANNQHGSFLSTNLPEENWPWPTASWDWRDRYAERLRDYILGLLWFVQNDPELPEDFRERALEWGLAKDEYLDNDLFPRQVYVREGRRIEGEHLFTARDALPGPANKRPPIYQDSITASHYAIDSHSVRKREPGRVHLDGFMSYPTRPYTVPLGVILPQELNNLLVPVAVSATHAGLGTLRMEPCWMALGQAAGLVASMAIESHQNVNQIDRAELQRQLVRRGGVLIYFEDAEPGDPHYEALQMLALRGFYPPNQWQAGLGEVVADDWAKLWFEWADLQVPDAYEPGETTRGGLLDIVYEQLPDLEVASRQAGDGLALAPVFQTLQESLDVGKTVDFEDAEVHGVWQKSSSVLPFVGNQYGHDGNEGKGAKYVVYRVPIREPGRYEVRVSWSPAGNRATNVPIEVDHSEGRGTVRLDQTRSPVVGGLFESVGTYRFEAGAATVTIRNEGTDGYVIADAVQLVKTERE